MTRALLVAMTWTVLTASAASAHGLYATIEKQPAVVMKFSYSSGEPLSYGAVWVHAPGTDDVEFQNGRTDATGRFSIVPDRPGIWTIECSDGMGHRAEGTVVVDTDQRPSFSGNGDTNARPRAVVILLGLSLIANVAWVLKWFKRNQAPRIGANGQ